MSSRALGSTLLDRQCEAAAEAIHDALCRDKGAPWDECQYFDVLGAATDAVLAVLRVTRECKRPPASESNDRRLQERVAAWHAKRFPAAQPYHVALKAMEELGELAEALNGHMSGGRDNEATSRRGNVPDEAADVAVCLLVLLGRWFPEGDLIERVEAKLSTLSDPDSGHRSALKRVPDRSDT